jgi:hypothetical protein
MLAGFPVWSAIHFTRSQHEIEAKKEDKNGLDGAPMSTQRDFSIESLGEIEKMES